MCGSLAVAALLVLCLTTIGNGAPKTVGPDLVARARLLRDLPLARTLSGATKVAPRPRDRTVIDMSLSVRSIDLDFATGTFRADGWMALKWNDERYAWNPDDYEGLTSVPLPFSSAWAPEVILHNAVEEKFIFRQVGVVKSNGDIVYLVAIHAKSGCKPNYEDNFPFGIQTCSLKFGSWVNEQYRVEYRVAPHVNGTSSAGAFVNLEEFNSSTGWQMVATEATLESTQYPLFEEPSHSVVFTFAFKRSTYFDANTGTIWKESENGNNGGLQRGDHSDF